MIKCWIIVNHINIPSTFNDKQEFDYSLLQDNCRRTVHNHLMAADNYCRHNRQQEMFAHKISARHHIREETLESVAVNLRKEVGVRTLVAVVEATVFVVVVVAVYNMLAVDVPIPFEQKNLHPVT